MRRGLACLSIGIALAGCMAMPGGAPMMVTPGPDRAAVRTAIARAAAQVQRCYRTPKVGGAGKRIGTMLRVRYAADGALIGLPELIRQTGLTPDNAAVAPAMAEAATLAVIRCAPLTAMPADAYKDGWDDFELSFNLRLAA